MTITLPNKWVKAFNLKKGDQLFVQEAGPSLHVSTTAAKGKTTKKIAVRDLGVFTKNNLSHLYQLGYDDIEIHFDDPLTLKVIKERLPECMGFEMIEQQPHRIRIKSIASTMEEEFDTLLRKSFLVTDDMATTLVKALKEQHYETLQEIRSMESLNNKFTDICIRILNKRGYRQHERTMQMYEVVKNIERIADEFKYICDLLMNAPRKLDKSLLLFFSQAADYYLTFSKMFYNANGEAKKKIYTLREPLLKQGNAMLEKTKGIPSRFVHHCLGIIQKTHEGAGAYFALTL